MKKAAKPISNLSVLYVENNQALQADISSHLSKIFSNVVQAFDGIEGLEKFQKDKVDLVLTDLSLLNKNSFEMIVEMREINPKIDIIVLSHQNSDFKLLKTLDLGLIALLEKPLDITTLNKALQQVIIKNKPKQTTKEPIKPKQAPIKQTIQEPIKPKQAPIKQTIQKPIKPKQAPIKQTIQKPIKPKQAPIKQTIQEPTKPKQIIEKTIKPKQIIEKTIKPKIDSCFDILSRAKLEKQEITTIGNFKGLIITNKSELMTVTKSKFTLKLNKSQFTAILYERQIITQIGQRYIHAKLIDIDKKNLIVTLVNPQIITYAPRDTTNKRIVVDKSFKSSIGFENTQQELKPIDACFHYIALESNEILNLNVNNTVELTIGFELNGPSSLVSEKKFTKAFATGIIQRIQYNGNVQKIIIKYEVQKSGHNIYKKYLQQRELEIITEFKMRMKK